MSTILVGVDASERSEDATAFARRLADASGAHLVLANAYPYSNAPSRGSNFSYREALREQSLRTVSRMRARLEDFPERRSTIKIAANPSPAHALHSMAVAEHAALVVVGSTHTGRAGRVLPGSTGERLLHGSPCAVAVVPKDYRTQTEPIRVVGVAYNHTPEARAAALAAAELARGLDAELEVIGVVDTDVPALLTAADLAALRADLERHVQEGLDALLEDLPKDLPVTTTRLIGEPADALACHSAQLDLLLTGSRGYGPLQAVLAGGVSGRLMRTAACPVIIVPRGVDARLGALFADAAPAAA